MKSVLIRLEGPMQSWGTSSRFEIRETDGEPSKSGVLGLCGAALGVERNDRARLAELAACAMAVRVDRIGVLRSDYQTAGGGSWPNRKRYGVYKASGSASSDATLSTRHYLADASFLVALGGEPSIITSIADALQNPKWTLWLGRKGYAASAPFFAGCVDESPEVALRNAPWPANNNEPLRLVLETASGVARRDVPLTFEPDNREFGVRFVRSEFISMLTPEAP